MKQLILTLLTVLLSTAGLFAQQTEQLYNQGRKEYKAGQYKKAVQTLSAVVSKSDFYYEGYTYRARAYHALGMEDSARMDFNTALKKNPDYLVARYYRGVYFFDLGAYDQAINDFNVLLRKKPTYAKALVYRGRSYEALGKDDMAMADYTKAIKAGTKNPELYYRRALLYKKHGDLKLAVYDLGKVVELDPGFQEAYSLRGIIEVQRGRYAESLKYLEKALELNPEDQAALEARAHAYPETGDQEKALADYNVLVTKYHTRNVEVYFLRGKLFVSQGEYSKASKDFARISVIDPRNDQALVENAKVYVLRGRPTQAIPLARKAITFNKDNWEAYYIRGKAYFDLERFPDAEKDLNTSIELHPSAAAYYYRGQCRAEIRRDVTGACEDLKKARDMGFELAADDLKKVCR
jgi:tetratricopeptide (TPR) repeat protein